MYIYREREIELWTCLFVYTYEGSIEQVVQNTRVLRARPRGAQDAHHLASPQNALLARILLLA